MSRNNPHRSIFAVVVEFVTVAVVAAVVFFAVVSALLAVL